MLILQLHTGGVGIFSRLIRWFTRSEYSHVSAWFYDAAHPHGGLVLEAREGKGVRSLNADVFREARRDGRIACYGLREPLTPDEMAALWAHMRTAIGAKYDWWAIFKFVTKRRHDHDDKWFCSEYVADGLKAIKRPLYFYKEPWDIQPGDIPASLATVRISDPEVTP